MADVQTYQFKWDNYDLSDYFEGRKFAAAALRRDAEILIKRANQIDEERNELERALIPTPSADADG